MNAITQADVCLYIFCWLFIAWMYNNSFIDSILMNYLAYFIHYARNNSVVLSTLIQLSKYRDIYYILGVKVAWEKA